MRMLQPEDVLLLFILGTMRLATDIYYKAVPITELSRRTLRNAIATASGRECPFVVEPDFFFDDVPDEERFIAVGDDMPVGLLRRVEFYVRGARRSVLVKYVFSQLTELSEVGECILHGRSQFASLIVILVVTIAMTVIVFGPTEEITDLQKSLFQKLRIFFIERVLLLVMISGNNDEADWKALTMDKANAVLTWSALAWSLESLATFSINRLQMLTELERLKDVRRDVLPEFRLIAISFTSMATSATMVSVGVFTLSSLPFFSTLLIFESFALFSNWFYVLCHSVARGLCDDTGVVAQQRICTVRRITDRWAHLSQFFFYSFLLMSLFVIHGKLVALIYVPRIRHHAVRFCVGIEERVVNDRNEESLVTS